MTKPMAKLRADRRAVPAGDNAAASARRPPIGASGERDLTRHNGYHEIVGSSKNLSRLVENQPGRSRNPGRSREIRVKTAKSARSWSLGAGRYRMTPLGRPRRPRSCRGTWRGVAMGTVSNEVHGAVLLGAASLGRA